MNRRNLFKLAAGAAAALILPPTLAENAEAGKRYWALGGIPKNEGLLSWQSDTVPNAVAQLGKLAVIDYDEVLHIAREFCENYYAPGHPEYEKWRNPKLSIRAVDGAVMLNAGVLARGRKV